MSFRATEWSLALALAAFVGLAPASTFAAELSSPTLGAYYGHGPATHIYGVEVQWAPECECAPLADIGLEPLLMAHIASWQSTEPTPNPSLVDTAVYGVARLPLENNGDVRFFAEAALGVHILSHVNLGNDRAFGIAFQFGERASIGVGFGGVLPFEIVAFVEHVSNARIATPNDGITYGGAELRIPLR